jgi:hypothetical protein
MGSADLYARRCWDRADVGSDSFPIQTAADRHSSSHWGHFRNDSALGGQDRIGEALQAIVVDLGYRRPLDQNTYHRVQG